MFDIWLQFLIGKLVENVFVGFVLLCDLNVVGNVFCFGKVGVQFFKLQQVGVFQQEVCYMGQFMCFVFNMVYVGFNFYMDFSFFVYFVGSFYSCFQVVWFENIKFDVMFNCLFQMLVFYYFYDYDLYIFVLKVFFDLIGFVGIEYVEMCCVIGYCKWDKYFNIVAIGVFFDYLGDVGIIVNLIVDKLIVVFQCFVVDGNF